MSSRRRAPANQSRQELVVYKKVSSDDEENGAPEYIRIPVETAERQAVKTPKGPALRQATPRRRPPTSQRRVELPREDEELPAPRTPRYRSSTPHPRATPKLSARRGNEIAPQEDGRGSPEERLRKSKLAKSLPRRSDGKFARKNEAPSDDEEFQSDGEREVSFREYANKKKVPRRSMKKRSVTPYPQRRVRANETSDDEASGSDDDDEGSQRRALVPKNNAPNEAFSGVGNFRAKRSNDDEVGDYSHQSNKVTHNNVNTSLTMLVISNSSISIEGSSSSISLL